MSADIVIEEVHKFNKRHGDYAVHGSNNTSFIMGTDRLAPGPATINDGLGHTKAAGGGKGTATVHIIAGRSGKDPDSKLDSTFLYLSKKTKADSNLGLGDIIVKTDDKPSAILKSDVIRIVGRKDIKICANDDTSHFIFMDGKKIVIKFGEGSIEFVNGLITIKSAALHLAGGCEKPWSTMWDNVISLIKNHDHLTAVGPSSIGEGGIVSATLFATTAPNYKAAWKSSATE